MAPSEFWAMSIQEVEDYLHGFSKRPRVNWETTRMLIDVICQLLAGETSGIKYPWDEANHDDEMTEEEVDQLRERAKFMEELLNKNK